VPFFKEHCPLLGREVNLFANEKTGQITNIICPQFGYGIHACKIKVVELSGNKSGDPRASDVLMGLAGVACDHVFGTSVISCDFYGALHSPVRKAGEFIIKQIESGK